jgi:hypothetical protein
VRRSGAHCVCIAVSWLVEAMKRRLADKHTLFQDTRGALFQRLRQLVECRTVLEKAGLALELRAVSPLSPLSDNEYVLLSRCTVRPHDSNGDGPHQPIARGS